MSNTTPPQDILLARFAEALEARHDHATVTHSELSAAWPGNPQGKSSLKQLLEVISPDWIADYRTGDGDYVFSRTAGGDRDVLSKPTGSITG